MASNDPLFKKSVQSRQISNFKDEGMPSYYFETHTNAHIHTHKHAHIQTKTTNNKNTRLHQLSFVFVSNIPKYKLKNISTTFIDGIHVIVFLQLSRSKRMVQLSLARTNRPEVSRI